MESNKTISVRDLMITGSLVFSVLGNLYANVCLWVEWKVYCHSTLSIFLLVSLFFSLRSF